MKRTKFFIFLVCLIFSMVGCRVSDMKTMELDVAEMATQKDAAAIEKVLKDYIPGAEVSCDYLSHKVKIKYEGMKYSEKNIEYIIFRIGYDVGEYKKASLNK